LIKIKTSAEKQFGRAPGQCGAGKGGGATSRTTKFRPEQFDADQGEAALSPDI
jgi:hypothetical protein